MLFYILKSHFPAFVFIISSEIPTHAIEVAIQHTIGAKPPMYSEKLA